MCRNVEGGWWWWEGLKEVVEGANVMVSTLAIKS
jgi:hypothetical protein